MIDSNDYELVYMAQEGNEEASNFLYDKYMPIIRKKANNLYKYLHDKGTELEDIIQECLLALEESIVNFNQDRDGNFYTFFSVCMNRKLINYFRELNRVKHKNLNDAISFELMDDDGDINLLDYIKDNSSNPTYYLFGYDEYINLYNDIIDKLTDFEECVFVLKIKGFSYDDIAVLLDKNERSINNAMSRIRLKVKNLYV